jgi:ferritin-like metal-binding protein YciE
MSKIDSFEDLFCHELSDLLNAEMQLTKALPKMAEAASDPALKAGFEKHLKETEDQIEKVKRVFDMAGLESEKITCEAMKGLIKEGDSAIEEFEEGALRDVALIIAAQKVEHYEWSGYGSAVALAKKLGLTEEAAILHEIMEQERVTDEKLSEAAKNINEEASEIAEAAE